MIVQILRTSICCRWMAYQLLKSMLFLFQRPQKSLNTATDDFEDNSTSSSPPRKKQLDPTDSGEVKRWKTRLVRCFNTTTANANADYDSEDSDDEIVDDNSPNNVIFQWLSWLTDQWKNFDDLRSKRQLSTGRFASSTQQTWEKVPKAVVSYHSTPIGNPERIRRWS